jgi:hypothetical protein
MATTILLPVDLTKAIESDARIVRAVVYEDGWVPNAYRYAAPGKATVVTRAEDGRIEISETTYDRKRSYGRGPRWVAFSAKGGRLASA